MHLGIRTATQTFANTEIGLKRKSREGEVMNLILNSGGTKGRIRLLPAPAHARMIP